MSPSRRRRPLFPGVPAPGDLDATHAMPRLADELYEREHQTPAMAQLVAQDPAPPPADDLPAELPDLPEPPREGTVQVRPVGEDQWQAVGQVSEPPSFTYEPDGSIESVSVPLGPLQDRSRDLPAATPDEVEAWRAEAPAHPVWGGSRPGASGSLQLRREAVLPEPEQVAHDEQPIVDPGPGRTAEPEPTDVEASEHLGPEWRRVIDAAVDPVEVRLGCGCQIVIRACSG